MIKSLITLPRTVWLIGLISLFNDAASGLVYPIIPLYLSSVLMAGPRAMGIIEGVAEATASLLKLFSGVMMDRTRRAKPWILFGYGTGALARPLIAVISGWQGLMFIRFADRLGKGLRTSPRDALLAASVDPCRRGLAFGVHRALDNAGAVIGPVLASVLLLSGMALRNVFLWTLVPAAICLTLALFIREPSRVAAVTPAVLAPGPSGWNLMAMPATLRRYLVVVAIFTLGSSSNMFLLLRAHELGVAQARIPLVWAGVSLVAMLFSTPLSALSDRVGRLRLLVAGYLAYSVFYFALGFSSSHGLGLYALFGFYGLFLAATEGVEKALVADLAPAGLGGSAFGFFNLTAGAMLLPASVVFGWMYETVSPRAAFAFSGTCAATGALLLAFWVRLPPGLAIRPVIPQNQS